MSSSKRDFTDFTEFPGELDEGTGYHSLPLLWHKDDAERWRMWQIHVRLIKTSDEDLSGIDWNLLDEKQVKIKPEYYEVGSKVPSNIRAEAWAETGIETGKITRSAPSYISSPVNEGKSNERNVFQQALIYARAQWLKKKDKGCKETKEDEKKKGKKGKNGKIDLAYVNNVMYFPMLAKPFKDGEKHLQYPLYIQPKLDGVRCLVFLQKKDGGVENVIAYTRAKKPFPSVDYLKEILYPYLNDLYDEEKNQSIFLDGELYKHGKRLQDISGDSRNEKTDTSNENASRNEYHVYDCFYPLELDTPFTQRREQLVALYDALSTEDAKVIRRVPTFKVSSYEMAEKRYDKFVAMGYEGAILRNSDGPYLGNSQKTGAFLRSKDLVKMKQRFSDEYECVGYTEGKRGKDKGAVIWICQTVDGTQFNVTPKDTTYEERYALFQECEADFANQYEGRMLTIEYEDLSKDGVPLRAKALTFRDYE
jgi:ATP-dependent DNA ligase